jgi:non-heme chloroperoxidase
MAMQASPKATLDCADAFGLTDFRPDLASFHVPTLVLHGTADKTVPIEATAHELVRLMPAATLIEYEGGAHGITATHADPLFSDLLQFLRG